MSPEPTTREKKTLFLMTFGSGDISQDTDVSQDTIPPVSDVWLKYDKQGEDSSLVRMVSMEVCSTVML